MAVERLETFRDVFVENFITQSFHHAVRKSEEAAASLNMNSRTIDCVSEVIFSLKLSVRNQNSSCNTICSQFVMSD